MPNFFSNTNTSPTYTPQGILWPSTMPPIFTAPIPQLPTINFPSGSGTTPSVLATGGGTQINNNTLDRILNGALSALAIIKNRPYVPTGVQPDTYSEQDQYRDALLAQQLRGQTQVGGNVAGQAQEFLRKNAGWFLLGGGLILLIQMKPFKR